MNNENLWSLKKEPGPPHDNYGVHDKLYVFMEMKNLKQCFERRSECVY